MAIVWNAWYGSKRNPADFDPTRQIRWEDLPKADAATMRMMIGRDAVR